MLRALAAAAISAAYLSLSVATLVEITDDSTEDSLLRDAVGTAMWAGGCDTAGDSRPRWKALLEGRGTSGKELARQLDSAKIQMHPVACEFMVDRVRGHFRLGVSKTSDDLGVWELRQAILEILLEVEKMALRELKVSKYSHPGLFQALERAEAEHLASMQALAKQKRAELPRKEARHAAPGRDARTGRELRIGRHRNAAVAQ